LRPRPDGLVRPPARLIHRIAALHGVGYAATINTTPSTSRKNKARTS
jgi:hypothetical protein